METKALIYACGIHSMGFALFHVMFWKIFNWKQDLKTVSVPTRAILQIANLRLIYVFILIGVICFIFPEELVQTALGNVILIGMSLFWVGRLIEQFIFLRYNKLMVHVLNGMFLLGAILFALPLNFK